LSTPSRKFLMVKNCKNQGKNNEKWENRILSTPNKNPRYAPGLLMGHAVKKMRRSSTQRL